MIRRLTPQGSSPRVWGQALLRCLKRASLRIIPTRVGTRPLVIVALQADEDHPHACGDKKITPLRERKRQGSSPRVWGQAWLSDCLLRCHGIIPTRVGTSSYPQLPIPPVWDHPHACGDKHQTQMFGFAEAGSSPRVWGQARCKN